MDSTKSEHKKGSQISVRRQAFQADITQVHTLSACDNMTQYGLQARTFLHPVVSLKSAALHSASSLSLSLSTYIPLDRTPFSELMTWGNLINIYMYFGREKWVEVGRWWQREAEEEEEEVQRDAKWGSFGSTWRASITIGGSRAGPDRQQGTQ
jgi:hypothetical protein